MELPDGIIIRSSIYNLFINTQLLLFVDKSSVQKIQCKQQSKLLIFQSENSDYILVVTNFSQQYFHLFIPIKQGFREIIVQIQQLLYQQMYQNQVSNIFDLLEVEETQLPHQNHYTLQSNYLHSWSLGKLEDQDQKAQTKEEVAENIILHSDLDIQQDPNQLLSRNNQEQEFDFMGNHKIQGKWQDHFQLPRSNINQPESTSKYFMYQLQLSQSLEQEHPQNQQYQIYSQKQQEKNMQLKQKAQKRRARVVRYLQKKAKRCFMKKISYQCRKTVADQRFRIKGRFVNKKIAQQIMKCNLAQNEVKLQQQYAVQLVQFHNQQN